VYRGDDAGDSKVWGDETRAWKLDKIAVYPALGNHDPSQRIEGAGELFSAFLN